MPLATDEDSLPKHRQKKKFRDPVHGRRKQSNQRKGKEGKVKRRPSKTKPPRPDNSSIFELSKKRFAHFYESEGNASSNKNSNFPIF
jgi:hypothetical protein